MTRLLKKSVAGIFVVLLLLFQSPVVATATNLEKTKTFTGFAFEKTSLTTAMKSAIQRWVMANPGYNMISCTGYTGHNVKNRTPEFLQKVAEDRAKNTCDFIHAKYRAITIYSTQGIPEDGRTPDARKVTIRLLSVTNTGGGSGSGVIGICDTQVDITMKSRFWSGRFHLATLTVKNISLNCKGKVLDVYLIDSSGNQLALAAANAITTTSVAVSYSKFDDTSVRSDAISQVAIEIRDP